MQCNELSELNFSEIQLCMVSYYDAFDLHCTMGLGCIRNALQLLAKSIPSQEKFKANTCCKSHLIGNILISVVNHHLLS